ncbi:MAG: PEP-CTERM sorting domain-containing protein [Sideroxyarcus sp.]
MTKSMKLRGLTVAALAAASLFAAQPAAADTITIKGYWAGAGSDTISFSGIDWHTGLAATVASELVGAGGFRTVNETTGGAAFQSFCVDIFHNFNFPVSSVDTLMPATIISTQAATDLGRLFTNRGAEVDVASGSSNAANEAAFQLAVWEIVNERTEGYNLASGDFQAAGADVSLAQTWLSELTNTPSVSQYIAKIWDVQSGQVGKSGPQDVVVFTPVPEPQTYAMMLVGLGLLGFSARRKNQNLG